MEWKEGNFLSNTVMKTLLLPITYQTQKNFFEEIIKQKHSF